MQPKPSPYLVDLPSLPTIMRGVHYCVERDGEIVPHDGNDGLDNDGPDPPRSPLF